MLTVHKSTPPTQHGRDFTPEETEAAGYLEEALRGAAQATTVTLMDAAQAKAAETISERFTKALVEQPGWAKFTALVQGAAELGAMKTADVRKAAAMDFVDMDASNFTLVNPAVASWADTHSAEMVSKIGATTKTNINSLVNGAVGGKMTVTQLTTGIAGALPLTGTQTAAMNNAVAAYFAEHSGEPGSAEKAASLAMNLSNSYTKSRAKMIARTELSNAQNAGHFISMSQGIQAGVMEPGTVKEWSTAEDEATCPICRPYDGQIVPWDKAFGNGLMTPPAHPNCRCTFNDLPPDVLDDPDFQRAPSEQELYGDTVTPQKPSPGWKGPDLTAGKPLAEWEQVLLNPEPVAVAPAGVPELNGIKLGQTMWAGDGEPLTVTSFTPDGKLVLHDASGAEYHLSPKSNLISATKPVKLDHTPEWQAMSTIANQDAKGIQSALSYLGTPGPGADSMKAMLKELDNDPQLLKTFAEHAPSKFIVDGVPAPVIGDTKASLVASLKSGAMKPSDVLEFGFDPKWGPKAKTTALQAIQEYVGVTPKKVPVPKVPKPSAGTIEVGNLTTRPGRRASDSTWIAWMEDNWIKPKWTNTEQNAITEYTGSWAGTVNDQLRTGGMSKVGAQARARALDAALRKSPAPSDLEVVRGTPTEALRKLLPDLDGYSMPTIDQVKSLVGKTVTDNGYMSTSVGKVVFNDSVIWNITVPKGSPAAWITELSKYRHEKEVLLPRGTKLAITAAKTSNGQLFLDAEVVPK